VKETVPINIEDFEGGKTEVSTEKIKIDVNKKDH